MSIDVQKQLNDLTETLRVVSNIAPTVEPGQRVELQVVSGTPDLVVTGNVAEAPTPAPVPAPALLTQIPVEIRAKWSAKGWSEKEEEMKELVPGVDFVATDGVEGPSAAFVFKPLFYELGAAGVLVPTPLEITATVTLHVLLMNIDPDIEPQEVVSKEITLPLSLGLLPLEIPTMLALFRLEKFRAFSKDDKEAGFVLLLVTENCYLDGIVDLANGVLTKIDEALAPIRSLASIAAFLTGLTILRNALSAQPMLRIKHGSIPNLTSVHMNVETRFFVDIFNRDTRANDYITSIIFMSAAGRVVGCYNDEKYDDGEGAFTVGVGPEMITLIPTMAMTSSDFNNLPNVDVLKHNNDDNAFNDSMTSVKYIYVDPPPEPVP